jgi:hypothetical protein
MQTGATGIGMTDQQTSDDTPLELGATHRVIASGRALPGFDVAHVQRLLEQRLKLPAATAARLLAGQPVVLKRGLDAAGAVDFCRRLHAVGLDVSASADAAPSPASAAPVAAAVGFFSGDVPANPLPTAQRLQLLSQTLRLLAVPLGYAALPLLVLALVGDWAVSNSLLLRTPPLLFSLTVYLLPLVAGLLLFVALLRPLLPLHRRVEGSIALASSEEPALHAFVAELCEKLGALPPQMLRLDLGSRVRIDLRGGRAGWQHGHYDLVIGLPLLLGAAPGTLVAALAGELVFARDAALLRRRQLVVNVRHWLRRHSQPQHDEWSELLARLPDRTVLQLLLRFEQWTQRQLGRLFAWLDRRSSHRAEQTLVQIGDRAAVACAGDSAVRDLLLARYQLDHARQRAFARNRERRIDRRPLENLAPLIGFYFEQGDVEHARKLERTIESGAAMQSGCGVSDRARIERAATFASQPPLSLQVVSVPALAHADAHGIALTELHYQNNGLGNHKSGLGDHKSGLGDRSDGIAGGERLPVELMLDDALLDLEQSEAGKLYFNGWLVPARGWCLPDSELLRGLSHAEAREQLNVCVNEVRRLTPDRTRLLNEFRRLQTQLHELLLGQQVLAARQPFRFRYFKYDGTSLAPVIEQRQQELGKIVEQLATQESIMGGRIALGLKLFGQGSSEAESLHRALDFLGRQERALYRLEQDAWLLEQLLERQQTLREQGHADAIARLADKVQDAAMRLLAKLDDAPAPPDRRYAPMRAFVEEAIDRAEDHAAAVARRARSILNGYYTLNEKLSMLAAEQASSVEDAYRIERIRLIQPE